MSTQRTGSAMYVIAIVGLITLLAWLFSDRIEERRNPNRDVATDYAGSGAARVVLQRNRAGHYVANGALNGVAVEFIVDTGATDVAVSATVARRAGLKAGRAIQVATANGLTVAYATRIAQLELGNIVEQDVRATIVPGMGDLEVLLGMSFLKRLDFQQRGDQLRLEQRTPPSSAPQS